MTNNPTNQPFEPFQVQSSLLKSATPQGGGESKGTNGAGKPRGFADFDPFGNWNAGESRWLAMPLFGLIYYAAQQMPELRPMTILVVLACLLFRMGAHDRELAGAPLTLAAIKLAFQMTSNRLALIENPGMMYAQGKAAALDIPWVPMFFAICLLYRPRRATVTGKIMAAGAICMLLSGLLPGEGYVAIFAMIQYMLFVGIAAGLIVDYSSKTNIGAGAAQAAR